MCPIDGTSLRVVPPQAERNRPPVATDAHSVFLIIRKMLYSSGITT